jgi:chromatin remodeling complex protein RSC6
MPAGKKTTQTKAKAPAKTASKAKSSTAAPVVESAAAAAPAEEAAWCAATEVDSLIAEFVALRAGVATALSNLREFQKKNTREIKRLVKSQSKKKTSSGPRKPSGFTKPTPITPELATFLGKPAGTEMARTDVTKEINAYIRAHDLQDKDNGRKINPDKKLAQLLQIKKDDELTYFNLQRFMSPHFVKANATA